MEKLIFISYSTNDQSIAFDIVDYFESQGIGCYVAPRDIQPGGAYASRLTKAIRDSKAAVVLVSSSINDSEHMLNEIDIMVEERKYFVPFFIEDFDMSPEVRYYFGRKQRIIAYPGAPSSYFDRLIESLSDYVRPVKASANTVVVEETPVAQPLNTQKIFSYIPTRGIMINPEDQQRNVSFRTDTFIGMLGGIYDEVVALSSPERASQIFHQSGYSCGYAFAQRLNSQWDLATSGASFYKEKLKKWCQFDSDVGWGKFDIKVDVNEYTGDFSGELTISECFIVDTRNKRHICDFVKGYCEGVIETLLGIKVTLVCKVCPLKNKFRPTCVFDILISED